MTLAIVILGTVGALAKNSPPENAAPAPSGRPKTESKPLSLKKILLYAAVLILFLVGLGIAGKFIDTELKSGAQIVGGFVVAAGGTCLAIAAADDVQGIYKDTLSLFGNAFVVIGGFALAFAAIY